MSLKDIRDAYHQKQASPEGGEITDLAEAFWSYVSSVGAVKDERRAPGYHPSQLYDFCPRLEILNFFFPKPDFGFIPPDLQMTFDWGSAWHWWTQNHYFGPMGVLWGTWKCFDCGRNEEGFMPDPCKECNPRWKPGPVRRGGYWTYIEPHLFNKEWQIPGHGDGILILSREKLGKRSLLEVKTMNGDMFKYLSKPVEKHVFQINVYLWLLGYEVCWITYWTKDA